MEDAFLDSAPLTRCIRPAKFGEIWDALVENNHIPLDAPIQDFTVLLKLCHAAAASLPMSHVCY